MTSKRLSTELCSDLSELMGDSVRFDEPLRRHTTLKVGGPADALVMPSSAEEVAGLARLCQERSVPLTPIGGGSNLLVRDGGIRGVVLSTRSLRDVRREGDKNVYVQCGLSTGKLLSLATKWELGGVEFLGGVPGSVGGGLVMNAGTYLGEFKDVVSKVRTVNLHTGEMLERDNAACGFTYRGSKLNQRGDEMILDAALTLWPRAKEEIQSVVRSLRERRKEREPKGASNAGSTFKNPDGDYAGRLIESVGFKGRRIGDAECSPAHANWFVNHGKARAAHFLELIDEARDLVKKECSVELRLEWKVVGEDET